MSLGTLPAPRTTGMQGLSKLASNGKLVVCSSKKHAISFIGNFFRFALFTIKSGKNAVGHRVGCRLQDKYMHANEHHSTLPLMLCKLDSTPSLNAHFRNARYAFQINNHWTCVTLGILSSKFIF
jgi:hypothetical protein